MSSFITMQLQQIWDKTLDLIKENSKVDTANFSVWFDGSQLFDIRDDLAIIVENFICLIFHIEIIHKV